MINKELRKNHGKAHSFKTREDFLSKITHWISPYYLNLVSPDFRHSFLPAFLNSPFFTILGMKNETLIEFTSMSSKHLNLPTNQLEIIKITWR